MPGAPGFGGLKGDLGEAIRSSPNFGPKGYLGDSGNPGRQGPDGPDGAPGPRGPPGRNGPSGPKVCDGGVFYVVEEVFFCDRGLFFR